MPDALIRFYNGNYFNTIKASTSLASNPLKSAGFIMAIGF